MKNYLIIFLWLITLVEVKAQLSGTAFLQSQTNHNGIRVKFIAQGGTAVTDSAYTTAAGSYSLNINPGVYIITYRKSGYVDAFYNNGASILLTNTTVLSGITLDPGNPVYVNGNVSGTWSNANVYVVLGDLTVPANDTLTIMAGTKVQFNGYFSILGNGVIKASGSSGNPILFTSGKSSKAHNDWKQISLSSSGSSFDYCIFEYASFAINFQNANANLTNNIFRHGGTLGAYIGAGTPLIENNEVYDLYASGAAIGIWVEGSATGTISCNFIHDLIPGPSSNGYGIIHNSSLVKDNHIQNITGPQCKGIQTRYSNSRNINNCISNSGIAIDIDGSWVNSNVLIVNNTLFANQTGIRINYASNSLNPTILNNLITGNTYGITQFGTASANSTITIDHNLLWNQSTADFSNVQIAGIGQTVTVNSSGYPVDSYFNVYQDPLYNGTPPFLSINSPCYGSGNLTYSGQIGFNNPMGCAATVISIHELSNSVKLNIFPNPTNGPITLIVNEDLIGNQIEIFNIIGELIFKSELIETSTDLNLSHQANGVYFVKIGGSTKKIIKE